MSKLFVFGCSHSAVHGNNLTNNDIKKYYEYRNNTFPKTWSELLAEDLNMELINMAEWGMDNQSMFSLFCKNIHNIEKNDLVIIGWTEISRFKVFSEKYNRFLSINPHTQVDDTLPNFTQKTIDEMLVNRMNYMWIDEVYDWIKVINKLSETIKFRIYYWSFYGIFTQFYIKDHLTYLGAESMYHETSGFIGDRFHFGEKGHKIQYEYIKERLPIAYE